MTGLRGRAAHSSSPRVWELGGVSYSTVLVAGGSAQPFCRLPGLEPGGSEEPPGPQRPGPAAWQGADLSRFPPPAQEPSEWQLCCLRWVSEVTGDSWRWGGGCVGRGHRWGRKA